MAVEAVQNRCDELNYISTRGEAGELGFNDVLLAGLARDGGLYIPREWPEFSADEIAAFAGLDYNEVAFRVMQPFIGGDVPGDELRAIIAAAYGTFSNRNVAPLVQIGPSEWLLELFRGPTFAFKDVAMQVLARLMDRALLQQGRRATIVVATSGDTGGAAIEAFKGRDAIDIFVLHPEGRVSDVQRRQMTTVADANVHNIAIQGTFDDAQALVKALFNDAEVRDGLNLAGVNSINWGRIMAQIVYYFTSAVALGSPFRPVSFSVPTGNFGDIYAGYVAGKMGLDIKRLIIATNVNDILARTYETGRYEPRGVVATSSPSMDIQISSNFERLLFDIGGRDPGRIVSLMDEFASSGAFSLTEGELKELRAGFLAGRASEEETADIIRSLYHDSGYVADPHTAVGLAVARKSGHSAVPVIVMSTAHPAKFPDVVEKAIGAAPAQPQAMIDQAGLDERFVVLKNDVGALTDFIRENARLGSVAS